MNKAKHVTSNKEYSQNLNPIIPRKMVEEYYAALNQYLKKYPSLNDADWRDDKNYMLISNRDGLQTHPNKYALSEWQMGNKKVLARPRSASLTPSSV